jgi:O-antigen/teichoic acid export membrane protein
VFGSEWQRAGEYAKILIPLFAVRFVVSPLSQLAAIGRNKELLFVNGALVAGGISPFLIAQRMGWSVETSLGWMTAVCSLIYLLYLLRLRQLSR